MMTPQRRRKLLTQYIQTLTPGEVTDADKLASLSVERAELAAMQPGAAISIPGDKGGTTLTTVAARMAQLDRAIQRLSPTKRDAA